MNLPLTLAIITFTYFGIALGRWPKIKSNVTAGLSNLVSNVPAVLLLKSIAASFRDPDAGWLMLATASTLAGNLTLLGSVANLIVAEIAARWRVDLNFWEYTRVGLVITLLSLIFGTLWVQIFFW